MRSCSRKFLIMLFPESRLIRFTRIRCRRYDIIKMSYDITRMTQAGELQPPCSGGDRHSSFADTDQREVAERRYQAALNQFHAMRPRQPLRIPRPGEFGGPEAERTHHRLQPLLEEAAHPGVA